MEVRHAPRRVTRKFDFLFEIDFEIRFVEHLKRRGVWENDTESSETGLSSLNDQHMGACVSIGQRRALLLATQLQASFKITAIKGVFFCSQANKRR